MPYAERVFKCPDCGQPVKRRANPARVIRCLEHAVAHSAEVQRQLHAKQGPLYDEWVQANRAALVRQVRQFAPVGVIRGA